MCGGLQASRHRGNVFSVELFIYILPEIDFNIFVNDVLITLDVVVITILQEEMRYKLIMKGKVALLAFQQAHNTCSHILSSFLHLRCKSLTYLTPQLPY